MIDKIIKDASSKGIHHINLSVVENNLSAINLYQSKGFIGQGSEVDSIYYRKTYYSLKLMSLLLE